MSETVTLSALLKKEGKDISRSPADLLFLLTRSIRSARMLFHVYYGDVARWNNDFFR
jgi:hypothetical protein